MLARNDGDVGCGLFKIPALYISKTGVLRTRPLKEEVQKIGDDPFFVSRSH